MAQVYCVIPGRLVYRANGKMQIIKIGKHGQPDAKRITTYGRGTEILAVRRVADAHNAEKALIRAFNINCSTAHGREYYWCEPEFAIKIFNETMDEFCQVCNLPKTFGVVCPSIGPKDDEIKDGKEFTYTGGKSELKQIDIPCIEMDPSKTQLCIVPLNRKPMGRYKFCCGNYCHKRCLLEFIMAQNASHECNVKCPICNFEYPKPRVFISQDVMYDIDSTYISDLKKYDMERYDMALDKLQTVDFIERHVLYSNYDNIQPMFSDSKIKFLPTLADREDSDTSSRSVNLTTHRITGPCFHVQLKYKKPYAIVKQIDDAGDYGNYQNRIECIADAEYLVAMISGGSFTKDCPICTDIQLAHLYGCKVIIIFGDGIQFDDNVCAQTYKITQPHIFKYKEYADFWNKYNYIIPETEEHLLFCLPILRDKVLDHKHYMMMQLFYSANCKKQNDYYFIKDQDKFILKQAT